MFVDSAQIDIALNVPETMAGNRLDQIASDLIPDYSRSRLQSWIKSGALKVNGKTAKPKDRLYGGEQLTLNATPDVETTAAAQAIALDVAYEDDSLLVINKPAGLVVHPAAGNHDGTLLNGLMHYLPQLESLPRAGIVHRLDKDTTGLMVVAKTLESHTSLIRQLQDRSVQREYEAITKGTMTGGGYVEADIGRHPRNRVKMAVVERGGKQAITHYRVLTRFQQHTHIRVKLETGRTHQVRVHMAHIGSPLVGDSVYGGRLQLPKGASDELIAQLRGFKRQALHAASLGLIHPESHEQMLWHAPLPNDLKNLLDALANDSLRNDP